MKFRLASYNIHKCVGIDRRGIPARIVAVMKKLGADIIALQEVDFRLGRRNAALPPSLINEQTLFAVAPFATGGHSLGWHGQTVLIRRDWSIRKVHRLPLPGLEPRGAVVADIGYPGGDMRVVGVHLGLIRRYRLTQLSTLRQALRQLAPMPTVMIGDFNDWSLEGGAFALAPDFRLHAPGRSFPAFAPLASLDRVALGSGTHMIDAGVYRNTPARVASDHLPIWADIRIDDRALRHSVDDDD